MREGEGGVSLEVLAKKLARQLDFTDARASTSTIAGCVVIPVIGTNCEGCGKKEEAKEIMLRIYRPSEIEEEMREMQDSVETEKKEEKLNGKWSLAQKLKGAFKNDVVQRGLYVGITVQIWKEKTHARFHG
ncbi:hypothetical protein JHK82_055740 [Glycine max]|nr:hypothetical protein JHK82_055740 [Glycine max]